MILETLGIECELLQILAHGGMGYAQEYHVERYMRECFVPRIAPVSRVSEKYGHVEAWFLIVYRK